MSSKGATLLQVEWQSAKSGGLEVIRSPVKPQKTLLSTCLCHWVQRPLVRLVLQQNQDGFQDSLIEGLVESLLYHCCRYKKFGLWNLVVMGEDVPVLKG